MMKATFILTPAEARRLIAKAVIQTPEFQKAWKDAYVLLAEIGRAACRESV